jgi:tRNA threonylcarbamoyladenosine biosynthesis protein TsaB
MPLVALDCSLRWTNVAVLSGGEDGKILASESLDIGRRQAAELPRVVERVLAAAGCGLGEIGLLAVTNGPGYFTGIRVGVSYAMALAYGLKIDIVPVSTLQMLACPYIEAGESVLALVYAGQDRAYAASFGHDENLPAGEYALAPLESWLSRRRAEQGDQKTTLVSDDPQKIAQALKTDRILDLPVLQTAPNASAVARIAWRARQQKRETAAVPPMTLGISYLREPQLGRT